MVDLMADKVWMKKNSTPCCKQTILELRRLDLLIFCVFALKRVTAIFSATYFNMSKPLIGSHVI